MTAKNIKKLVIGITACIMTLACVFSVMSFPESVHAASSPAPSASIKKTDYKTTDRKPTYTDTLNENNELLLELEKKLNGQNGEKENKALSFTKKYGEDIIDKTVSFLSLLKKSSSGNDADWEQFGVDLTKKLIVAFAGWYGFGGIADSVLNGLEILFTESEAPLDKIDIVADDISKNFNEMSDRLYDIQDQISALSDDVQKATENIIQETGSQFENYDAKKIIRAFMSQGEGNFSYSRYKNYIYGSLKKNPDMANAYYNQLMRAIAFGADDETVKYYYDKLYEAISSDISYFRQYYFGDVEGLDKSIAKYYYDYISANPSLILSGKTAESMALEFAYDLYSTYVFSYEIIKLCYSYQIAQIYIEESLKGNELNENSVNAKYKYNSSDYIYYLTILDNTACIDEYIEQAEEAVVNDISYILGMGDSYTVVDTNGTIHDIKKYSDTFGNIAYNETNKQTIYLNKVADSINSIFELDTNKYSYYINGSKICETKQQGIINPDDIISEQFNVCVKYGDKELYSIDFSKEVADAFSGGSGSYDDPYLISNEYQFLNAFYSWDDSSFRYDGKNVELNACYELISDLKFEGFVLDPIGTYEKPFKGILNGNGYTLSHLTINSLHFDETNTLLTPATGLFGAIGQSGIVENLAINNMNVDSDYKKDKVKPEEETSYYYIGGVAGYNKGTIYNCCITNSSITVHRNKQVNEWRNVIVFVGGIAGVNDKDISYCTVDSTQITADSVLKLHGEPEIKNQNSLFVAGITATTAGTVSYCRVSKEVKLSAYANSTANTDNKVKPYVTVKTGGIIADENGSAKLSFVYSDADIIKCRGEVDNDGYNWFYGGHRCTYDNVTMESGTYYPTYFWVSEGDSLDTVESTMFNDRYTELLDYCQQNGISLDYDYYDDPARTFKIFKDYLRSERLKAENAAKNNLGNRIANNYGDDIFNISKLDYNVEIKYECIHDGDICICGCSIEENGNCSCTPENDLIYEINTQALQSSHMHFYVNGEMVAARIVNYYGFDSYNEAFSTVENDVKIFFIADIDGEDILLSGNVVFTIREDRIVGNPVISGIKTEFEINSAEQQLFEGNGFTITYYYASGKSVAYNFNSEDEESVKSVRIFNFDTSKCNDEGFTFTIIHNGNLIDQTAKVICYHRSVSHTGDVPATCQTLGYEVLTCDDCGNKIHRNYTVGDHHYVVEDGKAATCMEPGHTQRVKCDVCGIVFEESEWIQVLEHDYISIEEAKACGITVDNLYSASDYHYCLNGGHYEPHQYIVSESTNEMGKMVYTYTCRECSCYYNLTDKYLITDEQGEMPTVFVTDGYVLNSGDEVTVYVQLLNNPGFNGAKFGIRYSEGLELLGFEEGMLITDSRDIRASCETYHGYNFVWATGSTNWTGEEGYLLKLIFKVTSEERSEQTVEIVYGDEIVIHSETDIEIRKSGFSTTDEKYGIQKFLTHNGTISFVSQLPGDVDGNGKVDIMDATYVAWTYVKKPIPEDVIYTEQYADVDLNGTRGDINDIVAILQSIYGNYGTNLLSSDYKITFNLNGFDEISFEDITVHFYNDQGIRNSWESQIDFDSYEAEMNRKGYTFIGWYNRLVGGERIDISQNIEYDYKLGTQTLYAHWVKNSVSFVMNGATFPAVIDTVEYEPEKYLIDLPIPQLQYDVDYYVSGCDGIYKSGTIYKTFDGWYLDGQKVTQINLLTANMGHVELEAEWSETYIWNLPKETRAGYKDITNWYWKQQFDDSSYLIGKVMDNSVVSKLTKTNDGRLSIYGQPNYIEYTINYDNLKGASNTTNSTKFTVAQDITLLGLSNVTGYSFNNWYNGTTVVNSITKDNFLSIFGNNISVTLSADWRALPIEVKINGINANSYNNGNYGESTLKTLYYCYGDKNHAEGYYSESSFTNKVEKFSYTQYANFDVKGCYGSTITNNGHSSNNGSQSVSYIADTAYFDESGNPTSLKPTTNTTIYAYCCPKQYTITFNLNATSYGSTSSSGYTLFVKAYYNEVLPRIEKMPTNTYYKAEYQYNGVKYYDFNGNNYGNKIANFSQSIDDPVPFTAYWGEDKPMTDNSYHTEKYKDYYYIKNATDLSNIRNYSNKSFILIHNISLSGGWTSIPSFSGQLDGNNMTITGLTITRDAYSGSGNLYLGLFGALSGKVFNLSIRDSSIYVDPGHDGGGWIYAGLVAGINSGTIDNVKVYSSSVTVHRNKSEIGGLAGDTGGTIQYCHVYGITVYGNGSEGGIAGGATGTIKNCSINGYNETKTTIKHYATSNDARQVGGVIGYSNGASIIECNVYNMEIILADGSDFKKMTCMGYIVGEQKGGTIYHVGKGEGCSYSPNRNSSSLYSGGGFLGIGAYDYRAYYFSQGWGYAGKLTNNPVIE